MKYKSGLSIKIRAHKRIAIFTGVILALLVVGVALALAVTVDNFDTGTLSLAVNSSAPTTASGFEASAGALGGDREAVSTWLANPGSAELKVNDFGTKRLNFNSDNGVAAKGVVRWDGVDAVPTVNNQGLSADLTGSGTNNSFDIEIVNDDLPVTLKIRVYNGNGNFSERTIILPGAILAPGVHVDYVVPFGPGNGWVDTGGGASWTAATSVEFEIDNSINPGADVSIDLIDADNFRDYGDLPSSGGAGGVSGDYGSAILLGSHIPQGLRLGKSVDVEGGPQPDPSAGTATTGDNNAVAPGFNDEEGVTVPASPSWTAGVNGGRIRVVVNGCGDGTVDCYLNGWIDWGNDGSFAQAGDQIKSDFAIHTTAPAGQVISFDIPASQTFNQSFYARFRLCPSVGTCNTVTAQNVVNGEVEDYKWTFGPTAITLSSLSAKSETGNSTSLILLTVAVLGLGTLGFVTIRRRRAHSL